MSPSPIPEPDFEFNISVVHFVGDIVHSVLGEEGLLDQELSNPELRDNIATAIDQIWRI